jgi:hypothetical protein
MLLAAAMVLSLVEVVVRLFVRWVLGVGFIVHHLLSLSSSACSLAYVSRWGDVFSRQNLVLQNETHSFCKTRHASQKKIGGEGEGKEKKRKKEGKERERKGEKKINFLSPDASLALRQASLILDMFTNK